MGNKLCRKRVDQVDGAPTNNNTFDRIINKFSLKPKWKSEEILEDNDTHRYEVNAKNEKNLQLSKSSDWTDVPLEVPEDDRTRNSNIFNDNRTPVPPPRKHKRGIREKIEAVAKSGLQAFQPKKPVEEPLCVKKTINYNCPCGDPNHKHTTNEESTKTRKCSSSSSLPNYKELKMSVGGETKHSDLLEKHSSLQSLNHIEDPKKLSRKSSSEKTDGYLTRARSFGSLLPTILLHKLSTNKAPLAEIESDDSLAMDDWGGLNMIEHYKPKDSSLPRPNRKHFNDNDLMAEIESQLVKDLEETKIPKPPVRKSESLIKKINRKVSERHLETSPQSKSLTTPPSMNESQKPVQSQKLYFDGDDHAGLLKHIQPEANSPQTKPMDDFLNAERGVLLAITT